MVRDVIRYGFPKMVFSYEQLVRDPLSIVCQLDDWLGLGLDSRAILRAVGRVSRSGGYVRAFFSRGCFGVPPKVI